jgi:stage II sporulation protein GA (sporulation sigma-E factor processing peptidase)
MPETVTVVYIDTLFVLNAVINYLLLLATAKITGLYAKRLRLLAGALVGAVYAVMVFMPSVSFLLSLFGKTAAGALIVIISFHWSKSLIRAGLVFTVTGFAFGGCIYAMNLLAGYQTGMVQNSIPYITVNARTLILLSALFYFVITMIFKGLARRSGTETAKVKIGVNEKEVSLTVLRDSGNLLIDPFSGASVMVVDCKKLEGLWNAESRTLLDTDNLCDPTTLLLALNEIRAPVRFRLVPYRAVGVESGFLLAFRPDSLEIDGKKNRNLLVALSPSRMGNGMFAGVINV